MKYSFHFLKNGCPFIFSFYLLKMGIFSLKMDVLLSFIFYLFVKKWVSFYLFLLSAFLSAFLKNGCPFICPFICPLLSALKMGVLLSFSFYLFIFSLKMGVLLSSFLSSFLLSFSVLKMF